MSEEAIGIQNNVDDKPIDPYENQPWEERLFELVLWALQRPRVRSDSDIITWATKSLPAFEQLVLQGNERAYDYAKRKALKLIHDCRRDHLKYVGLTVSFLDDEGEIRVGVVTAHVIDKTGIIEIETETAFYGIDDLDKDRVCILGDRG